MPRERDPRPRTGDTPYTHSLEFFMLSRIQFFVASWTLLGMHWQCAGTFRVVHRERCYGETDSLATKNAELPAGFLTSRDEMARRNHLVATDAVLGQLCLPIYHLRQIMGGCSGALRRCRPQ